MWQSSGRGGGVGGVQQWYEHTLSYIHKGIGKTSTIKEVVPFVATISKSSSVVSTFRVNNCFFVSSSMT